jgi:hypothetical protein
MKSKIMRPQRQRLSIVVTLLFVIITLLCTSSVAKFVDDDTATTTEKWYKQAKENYESLPDHGKFATGAVCGYGASKLVVGSGKWKIVSATVHVRCVLAMVPELIVFCVPFF